MNIDLEQRKQMKVSRVHRWIKNYLMFFCLFSLNPCKPFNNFLTYIPCEIRTWKNDGVIFITQTTTVDVLCEEYIYMIAGLIFCFCFKCVSIFLNLFFFIYISCKIEVHKYQQVDFTIGKIKVINHSWKNNQGAILWMGGCVND